MSAFCLLILFCLDGRRHGTKAQRARIAGTSIRHAAAGGVRHAKALVVLFTRCKLELVFPSEARFDTLGHFGQQDAIFPKRYCTIGIISHYFFFAQPSPSCYPAPLRSTLSILGELTICLAFHFWRYPSGTTRCQYWILGFLRYRDSLPCRPIPRAVYPPSASFPASQPTLSREGERAMGTWDAFGPRSRSNSPKSARLPWSSWTGARTHTRQQLGALLQRLASSDEPGKSLYQTCSARCFAAQSIDTIEFESLLSGVHTSESLYRLQAAKPWFVLCQYSSCQGKHVSGQPYSSSQRSRSATLIARVHCPTFCISPASPLAAPNRCHVQTVRSNSR